MCVRSFADDAIPDSKKSCMCDFLETMGPARMDLASIRGGEIPCENGFVSTGDDTYPCHNVNLLSRVSLTELNAVQSGQDKEANDCWGWTAPTGEEIAMIGLMSGVFFVDITDPVDPVILGNLPARGRATYWHDMKTYKDHAFIVSENDDHGMQVIPASFFSERRKGTIARS
jgi:choice-of-anchor B domain-containing protein